MDEALHELSGTLGQLDTTIKAQIVEHQRAERRRNWRSWVTAACAVVFAACAVVLVYVAFTNRSVLDTINSVTGPSAQDRQAAATAGILQRNAVETDCRSRRLAAGLPAPLDAPPPPPGITARQLAGFLAPYTCVAQTDPSVYPGGPGGQRAP